MATNYIGNYSPDDFTIILSKGEFIHRITGFADGTFINMERIIPSSTPYQGVGDNSQVRTKRRITSMNVTVTLHHQSPSNSVLQQLQLADANSPGNEWVFSCTMKDPSGQTVASSASAIIAAPASAAFSSETTTRDWQIYMFGSDLFIGGGMPLDPADVNAIEVLGGTVEDRWKLSNQ